MIKRLSERIETLPKYIFSEINEIKSAAQKRGVDLLSLAIGDPDQPTPDPIVDAMKTAIAKTENHQYSPYEGTAQLRNAFAQFAKRRFGISLNPQTQVLALIGSKEGLAHFPLAYCNPNEIALHPSPGFPMYSTAIVTAGGIAAKIPLRYENGYLPDLGELKTLFQKTRPRFIFLNYPHNPTSACCDRATLTQIVALAREYNVAIAYDNAYSEIYYDDSKRPISILEIDGASDVAIEFHSLSKTFNMTGWRIAFAVGNETLIRGLLKVKTNIDSGPFPAAQEAAAYALDHAETLAAPIRALYKARKARLLQGLDKLGIEYLRPDATFFVWAKVPTQESSMEFTKSLIENYGLVLTPGVGFGVEGEGFVRFSLTVDESRIDDAIERLRRKLDG